MRRTGGRGRRGGGRFGVRFGGGAPGQRRFNFQASHDDRDQVAFPFGYRDLLGLPSLIVSMHRHPSGREVVTLARYIDALPAWTAPTAIPKPPSGSRFLPSPLFTCRHSYCQSPARCQPDFMFPFVHRHLRSTPLPPVAAPSTEPFSFCLQFVVICMR